METRSRVALCVLTIVALVATATPAATAETPLVGLTRGAEAKVAYLVGTTIHADGTTIELPASIVEEGNRYTLLGETAEGWAVHVIDPYDEAEVPPENDRLLREHSIHYVTAGGTVTSGVGYSEELGDYYFFYRLAGDGKSFLEAVSFDSDVVWRVRGLDDTQLAFAHYDTYDGEVAVKSFTKGRIVFNRTGGADQSRGETRTWTGGLSSRVSNRPARFADIEHNILATSRKRKTVIRRLKNPQRVFWEAKFQPVRISANGKRIVGFRGRGASGRDHIQIRRLTDGKVLARFKSTKRAVLDVTWQSNRSIVMSLASSTGSRLVRCNLAEECALASDNYATPVTFPTTH
jgi:hypothetical protein